MIAGAVMAAHPVASWIITADAWKTTVTVARRPVGSGAPVLTQLRAWSAYAPPNNILEEHQDCGGKHTKLGCRATLQGQPEA